ncbi:alkaline phosphatase family protein [Mycobacterium basiliense]|nr:alkaline phosphatase family protein [Mycobacterium basiliense]
MSRRELLTKAAAATSSGTLLSFAGPVIVKAYGAGPCSGHLTDVEHIVLLRQENRSFDHYFGTLSGVNGFSSGSPLFAQKGWNPMTQTNDPAGTSLPFRFDTTRGPALPGSASTTPTAAGSSCTRHGTAVPTTIGYRRRPRSVRCRATHR